MNMIKKNQYSPEVQENILRLKNAYLRGEIKMREIVVKTNSSPNIVGRIINDEILKVKEIDEVYPEQIIVGRYEGCEKTGYRLVIPSRMNFF